VAEDQVSAARTHRAVPYYIFTAQKPATNNGARLAESADKEFRYWTERAGYTIKNGGWAWTLDGNFRLSWDPQTKTLMYSRPDSQTISIGSIADDPLIRLI
jgi:hypothetical protein